MTGVRRQGTTGTTPWRYGLRALGCAGLALAAGFTTVASATDAPPPARPAASSGAAALALCHAAIHAPAGERSGLLDRAYEAADAAVEAAPQDPIAHFAVFCALGRRLRLAGFSFGALRAFRRMQVEIDATLALAPDFVDALVGKGAMLGEAPRMVGGDLDESERLLRRALELAPSNPDALVHLGHTLLAKGRRAEARAAAERGLVLAEQQGSPVVAEAQRLVAAAR